MNTTKEYAYYPDLLMALKYYPAILGGLIDKS